MKDIELLARAIIELDTRLNFKLPPDTRKLVDNIAIRGINKTKDGKDN